MSGRRDVTVSDFRNHIFWLECRVTRCEDVLRTISDVKGLWKLFMPLRAVCLRLQIKCINRELAKVRLAYKDFMER